MRRRVATSRITLQANALPETAEFTELNYRTCVTTPGQDAATVARLVSLVTLFFLVVGFGLRLLTILPLWISVPIVIVLFVTMLAAASERFLRGMPSHVELFLALVVLIVGVLFGFVNYAPTMRSAYLLIFGPAVLLAAAFTHFVTIQACAFMAVNERMTRHRMRRWLRHLSRIETLHVPAECPELADYRLSLALLLVAFAVGFGVLVQAERIGHAGYAAIFGVFGFLATLVALRLFLPGHEDESGLPFASTVKATWRALTTFVCYNRHQVEAAGLFRFPTKLLRPSPVRDLFLGVTLAFLTTALVGVSVSSPSLFFEQYWPSLNSAEKKTEPKPVEKPAAFKLSPIDEEFSRTLPESQRAPYFEAKKRDHAARETELLVESAIRRTSEAISATGAVLCLCLVGPSLVLFTVMWFASGQLLNRFYVALEAPDAYEVPPTTDLSKKEPGVTPWDNRIERMMLSKDMLETEHLYLGSSIEGDFPVLLHQNLLFRHAHILGDTGSRKTSIGIAPLVTQLIARRNSSVIIFDLKGDRALFNAVRDEANSVGLPFKWFTNIVGKSSYGFNPLRQSHLHHLTTWK